MPPPLQNGSDILLHSQILPQYQRNIGNSHHIPPQNRSTIYIKSGTCPSGISTPRPLTQFPTGLLTLHFATTKRNFHVSSPGSQPPTANPVTSCDAPAGSLSSGVVRSSHGRCGVFAGIAPCGSAQVTTLSAKYPPAGTVGNRTSA